MRGYQTKIRKNKKKKNTWESVSYNDGKQEKGKQNKREPADA